MIESPVHRELIADCKREAAIEARQGAILKILVTRFGAAAKGLEAKVRAVNHDRLEDLIAWAATCPSFDSFREQLSP
jgi:hypothetical protein